MPATPHSPAHRLRALMDLGCVAAPGAFNGLCARAIRDAGFSATYISGAATSVCAGVPDVGLLTLEHFCRVIREVVDSAGLPLIADADTGFGEAEMVRRTVIEYHRAGAAGLHLEDQQFPKRCGHLDGKELVSTDHMLEKIQWAAKAARDLGSAPSAPPAPPAPPTHTPLNPTSRLHHIAGAPEARLGNTSPMIICARTDARGVEGFGSAVARARQYVDAGAEMIFPEGLATADEFATFAAALRAGLKPGHRVYLLANMTEFGKTPLIPLNEFARLGYDYVIYPVSLLRTAMGAVTRALKQLKNEGSVAGFLDQMQTRKDLYTLVGYEPGTPWEFPAR
ncbi:methylisocitrate lyase [soil metagenome]